MAPTTESNAGAAGPTKSGTGVSMPFASHWRNSSACAEVSCPEGALNDRNLRENACELMTARLNQVPMPNSMWGGSTTYNVKASAVIGCRAWGDPQTGII